ncbi:hypothetical protein SAMN05444397_1187 [Flavobacterium aquidurense]|uniref:Outer membrane protein beta-barrel family protein n=1 Tax=Flavobacterium frigidimaris TaxID=262320 RepID=A0ABX4BKW7_FLAFR|nr:hypothetical protein B0A65_18650 [Flavobacterium frigidimaris]SDZ66868.1 hypothetical protein SAMN05444397_1187 [Flavobacterium aquidurense]
MVFLAAASTYAQEKIFANYFDIQLNSEKNTEVVGGINLERNKYRLTSPITKTYRFTIAKQEDNLFSVETRFDPKWKNQFN